MPSFRLESGAPAANNGRSRTNKAELNLVTGRLMRRLRRQPGNIARRPDKLPPRRCGHPAEPLEPRLAFSASAAGLPDAVPAAVSVSPPLGFSFEGTNFDQSQSLTGAYAVAAHPSGAVGRNQLLSIAGNALSLYSKTGVEQGSSSLTDFFADLSPVGSLFDPRVVYDNASDRFIVVALERRDTALGNAANSSRLLLAVSNTANLLDGLIFQAIDTKVSVAGIDSWADFPALATDADAIYVTVNLYAFGGTGAYQGSRLWIVPKSPLYAGGLSTPQVYNPFAAVGLGAGTTAIPAQIYGSVGGASGTFLVSSGWTSGQVDYLSVIRVANPLTGPTFTNQFINLGNIDDTSVAVPRAPQPGTTQTIATGDNRIQSVVWRNNSLYAVSTIVPVAGPDAGQATVHWYRVNTANLATLSLADQGNVGGEDIATATYTFNPSISVDGFGAFAIGFSASGANVAPGAYYVARIPTDPASTVEGSVALATGQDYFNRAAGGSPNSWGPYSSVTLDPATDVTFWLYNQYAISRGTVLPGYPGEDGRWGTRWGRFRATSATPVVSAGGPYQIYEGGSLTMAAAVSYASDERVNFRWEFDNGRFFIDPTGNPTLSWSVLNALGITGGPVTLGVTVRMYNQFGAFLASGGTTLTVLNLPPIAYVEAPDAALRGAAASLLLAADDPSPDGTNVFTFNVNWGDGTTDSFELPSGSIVTHTFDTIGTRTLRVIAVDPGGSSSIEVLKTVTVTGLQLAPNPENGNLSDLVWTGTAASEVVKFEQLDATTVRVTTTRDNGVTLNIVETVAGVTGRVVALGDAGADTIDARGLATIKAELDGGGGNNVLYGGQAGDVLIGGVDGGEGAQGNNVIIAGNGNNTIFGNGPIGAEGSTGGNNIIVGGSGNDTIYGAFAEVHKKTGEVTPRGEGGQNIIVGGGGQDVIYASQPADGPEGGHGSILIAGRTSLNQAALSAVLAEWASSRAYAERVANIQGTGTGDRSNGNNFLRPGITVFNDASIDEVYSDTTGLSNWLFVSSVDAAYRVKTGEVQTSLD